MFRPFDTSQRKQKSKKPQNSLLKATRGTALRPKLVLKKKITAHFQSNTSIQSIHSLLQGFAGSGQWLSSGSEPDSP
jgi:hypothetical protein